MRVERFSTTLDRWMLLAVVPDRAQANAVAANWMEKHPYSILRFVEI